MTEPKPDAEAGARALIAKQPKLANADLLLIRNRRVTGEWSLLYVSFEEGRRKYGSQVVDNSAIDVDRALVRYGKTMRDVDLAHVGRDGRMIGWLSR